MLNLLSKVNIIDNSGGKIGRCIHIYNDYIILVSVIKVIPGSRIKRGDIYKAMLVRSKKHLNHKPLNDSYLSWSDNAVVLIKDDFTPIGTRIKGPISKNLERGSNTLKVLALAKTLI